MNDIKPIWQRPAKEVEEDEYKAFYKTFSKVRTSAPPLPPGRITARPKTNQKAPVSPQQDSDDPLAHIHFTAEGEVTFKSILFVPTSAPRGLFDEYGTKKNDYIKVGLAGFRLLPSTRACVASDPPSACLTAVCAESLHH